MQGETRLAANLARQSLACLPVSSDFSCGLRSVATSLLGDACWLEGDLAEAQRAYTDAVQISQAAGNIPMIIISNSNLAEVLLEQGQLQLAARSYAEALQIATLPDGQISPLAESVYAGLGRIAYERNHLAEAAKYIQQCLELSRRWGSFEAQAIGYVLLARLEHAQGHPEIAGEAMRAAEQLISEHPLTPWRSISLKCALARLWIVQGDLQKASYLVQTSGITDNGMPRDGEISTLQAPLYLILLRLHQARGDCEAVLALAERLLQKLNRTKRMGRVIEILVLQALTCQGKKESDQALATLEKAISLARPEKYMRVFLDEGEPMAKLLYQAKSHQMGTGYAAELLSAMGHAFGSTLPPAQLLIEPLTLRELEVLKLIETGYSNQEIATKFVISMPTVKRHISNIYTKLEVSSRTQAISRGKELNLFK
jgi:LuxR family maltose regulon positive regulatory protein